MANFRPKIGQDATFVPTFNGRNSAIFYPILTFDRTKMTSSARQIKCYILTFWSTFCSKASHGQHWVFGPKTSLKFKLLVHVLAMAPNS